MQSSFLIFIYFFLEVIFFEVFFGQVCGNLGKNPSHPEKDVCSYACAQTGWLWFLLIVWVNVISCRVTL